TGEVVIEELGAHTEVGREGDEHRIQGALEPRGQRRRRSSRPDERLRIGIPDQAVGPPRLHRSGGRHGEGGQTDTGDDVPIGLFDHEPFSVVRTVDRTRPYVKGGLDGGFNVSLRGSRPLERRCAQAPTQRLSPGSRGQRSDFGRCRSPAGPGWRGVGGARRPRRRRGRRRPILRRVSCAAWPASPRRRWATASNVAVWCSWSLTSRATATLVSTSRSAPPASPLVGITQRPDVVVADRDTGGWNHQAAVLLLEVVAGQGFDSQPTTVGADLYDPGPETEPGAALWGSPDVLPDQWLCACHVLTI